MKETVCVVLSTCPDRASAERLAGLLVEERLAACVSIGAEVHSIYPWQGQVERAQEIPLTLKTTQACLARLKQRFIAEHPYEVPEFLVLPVIDGLDDYLQWVRDWTQ